MLADQREVGCSRAQARQQRRQMIDEPQACRRQVTAIDRLKIRIDIPDGPVEEQGVVKGVVTVDRNVSPEAQNG